MPSTNATPGGRNRTHRDEAGEAPDPDNDGAVIPLIVAIVVVVVVVSVGAVTRGSGKLYLESRGSSGKTSRNAASRARALSRSESLSESRCATDTPTMPSTRSL